MVKITILNELDNSGEKVEESNLHHVIGPFRSFQFTYGLLRLFTLHGGDDVILRIKHHDCLVYDGKVFGDFIIEEWDMKEELTYEPTKFK